jgi:hypothetical protein
VIRKVAMKDCVRLELVRLVLLADEVKERLRNNKTKQNKSTVTEQHS